MEVLYMWIDGWIQDIRCDRASNGICSESLTLPSFSPSLGLRLSVSAGLDSSLSLPETTLFHQGVSLCHPPSPSRSFFLSSSLPICAFRSITFPVYQHPPLFVSVCVSLSFPSPCLRLFHHGNSAPSLFVFLFRVEPPFTLFCLYCHSFLSVFGKHDGQEEARGAPGSMNSIAYWKCRDWTGNVDESGVNPRTP